ncbi:MAG TPA: 2-hydroxyacyl-CoA dehydratase [Thermodesulfobacteriota bacterium]|nr:2-hydroxyacyl-CoA dehydratase [Thermodesulfobacteriota bacterium]
MAEHSKSSPNLIGLTSTVPVEIILAAGKTPVDLNNIFITAPEANAWVEESEEKGFPRTLCSWIKGIYSALQHRPEIRTVIAVTQGDCSNTQALTEILCHQGVEVLHFEYPYGRDKKALKRSMEALMDRWGVSWYRLNKVKKRLTSLRKHLARLDLETWKGNRLHGWENHLFLVSSSDFEGNPERFEKNIKTFLKEVSHRFPLSEQVRLGFIGIPPIQSGIYEFIESLGSRVVFNEVQRQFSMPFYKGSLVQQYLSYTYPYDIWGRINDIQQAVAERRLDGLIHYTQSFCFRQVQDLLIRKNLSIPILTLEGDKPRPLDNRSRFRIESFIDVLRK